MGGRRLRVGRDNLPPGLAIFAVSQGLVSISKDDRFFQTEVVCGRGPCQGVVTRRLFHLGFSV